LELVNTQKELQLKINWEWEEYFYSHIFSLDRIGFVNSSIKRNEVELKKPNSLYKFYSNTPFSLDSLSKGYFYFSSPRNFNDPFDCLTNREKFILRGGKGITLHRENLGVCCFSIEHNNPLMWGHYTKHYQGFCLKFKNQSLLTGNNMIKDYVSYLKLYEPSNQNLSKVLSEVEKIGLSLNETELIQKILLMQFEYCSKYYDWQYEQEYRAISWTTQDFNRRLPFEKEKLECIFIGYKMKEADPIYYQKVINTMTGTYQEAKIFEVKPHPLVWKLTFEEIVIST